MTWCEASASQLLDLQAGHQAASTQVGRCWKMIGLVWVSKFFWGVEGCWEVFFFLWLVLGGVFFSYGCWGLGVGDSQWPGGGPEETALRAAGEPSPGLAGSMPVR